MKAKLTLILLVQLCCTLAGAQKQTPLDIALHYVEQQWQLPPAEIMDLAVSNLYESRHNQLTHIYFAQRHKGIELHNAISGVHLRDGKVLFATNRFTPALSERINTSVPTLTAHQAIEAAAAHLGLSVKGRLQVLEAVSDKEFRFEGGHVSQSDIRARLMYQLVENGKARLTWSLAIDMPNSADYWNLRVDALTGEILGQDNWTTYCRFEAERDNRCLSISEDSPSFIPLPQTLMKPERQHNGAQYRVFPIPAESPAQGEHQLLIDPADPASSPFGWHDTDGQEGPEFFITRGNNVHAYPDRAADNESTGEEPEGGEELLFDFPFDPSTEPEVYSDASTTQLFYMNNFMHDFAYRYGFDEAAGNFQQNNYGNGGVGSDYVLAESQDGSGKNNANFATPPDGENGRMQMFLWSSVGSVFRVDSPAAIAGTYSSRQALFGGDVTAEPLSAEVVIVDDGSGNPSLGCGELENAVALEGKIALIDRGICEFGEKALNAQNAGALGVIICNYEDALVFMGEGLVGWQVDIPVVSMEYSGCQSLKDFIGQGVMATLQLPDVNGPALLDGSLDNGIIAHEYAHGISNRLTGGPATASCLSNDEQMGEGWSDFFALALTARPGDTGSQPRPVSTYVLRQETTGTGIRSRPYSTDWAINDRIFEDIVGTESPYPVGEVWGAVLWDLYWALVEEYGWESDLLNGDGGNNIAIQLVMDGMKLQACEPGLVEGRDAILMADELNNGGANQCLIWKVFARRGLGYLADGGSPYNRHDGLQAFGPLPECVRELKLTKSVTELVEAGEEVVVTLNVRNDKSEELSGVVVTDEIPDGASYVTGSATGASAVLDAGLLSFELGPMQPGTEITLTYRFATSPNLPSVRQFYDDMEDGEDNWFYTNLDPEALDIWELSDFDANSGNNSWFVPDVAAFNDQALQLLEPVTISGTQPVLRFYHRYETEPAFDGGFVEASTDGGNSWEQLGGRIFKNPYSRPLSFLTLPLPNLRAYSGSSEGAWIASYIGLSDYIGEELLVRWRFASNVEGAPNAFRPGWYVDDVEFMDLVNYNAEACVSAEQGDQACVRPMARGTLIETGFLSDTDGPLAARQLRVFPNPAREVLFIRLRLERPQEAILRLLNVEGRLARQQQWGLKNGIQQFEMAISGLPAGLYFLRVNTEEGSFVEKVVVRGE